MKSGTRPVRTSNSELERRRLDLLIRLRLRLAGNAADDIAIEAALNHPLILTLDRGTLRPFCITLTFRPAG